MFLEDVYLPCEFCGESIMMELLDGHQKKCLEKQEKKKVLDELAQKRNDHKRAKKLDNVESDSFLEEPLNINASNIRNNSQNTKNIKTGKNPVISF